MESLHVKKAIFRQAEIVILRKKGNVIINIDDIKQMEYTKPTFFNYVLGAGAGSFPGYIKIWLDIKINKSKTYFIKIKFKDVSKLPEFYLKKIDPSNRWGLY